MSRGTARYLVMWRSNEHEWNGREGKRFWRRDSADRAFERAVANGFWNVVLFEDGVVVRREDGLA